MAGLEPANEGVKVPCLTAWLHPYWEERAGIKSHPSLFVGWVKGLEPSTPGTTIRCSNQLSYTHHISGITREALPQAALGKMVRQKGFEPPAYCLEGSCSILLSYWRKWMEQVTGIEPASPAWKAGALAIVLHLQEPSATCQLLHDSTEAAQCQDGISHSRREMCNFRRLPRKTACNGAQDMVSYHGMQRYRSGHNGADSKWETALVDSSAENARNIRFFGSSNFTI